MLRRLCVSALLLLSASAQAAISVVGTPVTPNRADDANTTAPLGGTTASGDLNVAYYGCNAASSCAVTTPLSGYTTADSRTGGAQKLYVDWKASGVADANPTVTDTVGSAGDQFFGGGLILRGVNTTTPVHASVNSAPTQTSNALATPALTITANNTYVCLFVVLTSPSTSVTAFGSFNPNGTGNWTQHPGLLYSTTVKTYVQAYCSPQTTAANISAGSIAITGGLNTSQARMVMVAFASAAVTPQFTGVPTIGTRTTSSIPFNLTSDTTGTVHAARFTDGTSLGSVTCDQLDAQTASGAVQYANEAVVATVADTLTFTGITNGTKTDGAFCIEDASGNDSAVYTSGDAIDMVKLPAWDISPTCAASSATAIGCNFTLDGPGNVFGVACKKDLNDATTAANVVSAACSASLLASANKAVTAADSLSLTGITLPVADVFLVGRYVAGTNTARVDQLDEVLIAPTGYKPYIALGTLGTSSANPVNKYNARPLPDAGPGDYATVSTTDPDNYDVELNTGGGINIDGPPTAQIVRLRYYNTSAGDWHAEASPTVEHEVWVNWLPPNCNPQGYRSGAIKINTNPGTVALSGYVSDPQESTLAYALQSGSLAGRSLNAGSGDLTGNIQNTEVESGVDGTVRTTNDADLYCDLSVQQFPINTVTVPACTSLAACEAQLASVWLTGTETWALSLSVPGGNVSGQSPVAGNQAEPNSNVLITYSRGLVAVTPQAAGYQLSVTPLNDTTAYAAALRRNACVPNAEQLAAGTDCMGGAALATHSIAAPAGVTTSLTLTGLELPRHDVYIATQDDVGGDWSAVLPILNQQKLPDTGRQYIQVAP